MEPKHIIIHHSLTKDSRTVSWSAIRRYHTEHLGWRDIGYHFGIEQVKDKQEVLFGRFPDETGAHCKGMNREAIGVCCVGNYDLVTPPPDQWELCLKLVRWLMKVYSIPGENVYGHYEFAPKSCPGKYFDLDLFRNKLEEV